MISLFGRKSCYVSVALLIGLLVAPVTPSGAVPGAGKLSLTPGLASRFSTDPPQREFSLTFGIDNGSATQVRIKDLGSSRDGLDVLKSKSWSSPKVIAPHRSKSFTVAFRVVNCAEAASENIPLTFLARSDSSTWMLLQISPPAPTKRWQTQPVDRVCN